MRTLCVIPARGGSVRIPRKNIKPFHGKPIIEYSIGTARACRLFDSVVVSTDDLEVEDIAREAGADVFRRDKDDGARGTQEVAAEVLREFPGCGLACVLYPCAPLITSGHLVSGWQVLHEGPSTRYTMSVHERTGEDIGGFYWGFAAAFVEGAPLDRAYTKPIRIPSEHAVDINTMDDWMLAEAFYTALRRATP